MLNNKIKIMSWKYKSTAITSFHIMCQTLFSSFSKKISFYVMGLLNWWDKIPKFGGLSWTFNMFKSNFNKFPWPGFFHGIDNLNKIQDYDFNSGTRTLHIFRHSGKSVQHPNEFGCHRSDLLTVSWQMYPMASSDASINDSALPTWVTFWVRTGITSGHSSLGTSMRAMYATHCAAELGRIISDPRLSITS